MKKKSKEKIMKITLVIVIITSIFVMINNYKKNQPLESIKVDNNKVSKETYAMYKENSNGEYIQSESNEFPNNELYELNISKSYCVDRNENKIDNIITVEGNKPKVSSDKTVYCYLYYDVINKEWEFAYTGGEQTFTVPESGTYKIETWGGSVKDAYYENSAGYSSGIIMLNNNINIYIYVAGEGTTSTTNDGTTGGGYNGGGYSGRYINSGIDKYLSGGGGATDVRLVNGKWDNINSLRSRIIVAGGSSGVPSYTNADGYFGFAGGLFSYGMEGYYPSATQTNGYSFGIGQSSGAGVTGTFYGYGGGGGYYGGYTCNGGCNGSGGSSYISGHTGCVAITSASDTTPKSGCTTGTSDIECSKHYSGYVFTDTLMIDGLGYKWTNVKGGQVQMPKPDGTLYPLGKGHSGNGYAKITFLG